MAACRQKGEGNRQIKDWPFFPEVCRCQVDHHPHQWSSEAAVAKGGAHPLSGFLYGFIGQPHQLHAWKTWGEVHLHGDRSRIKALQGSTETTCQHLVDE